MLGEQQVVAFAAVTDLEAGRRFYGQQLGLALVEESPFACVFDANGTALRVTRVEAHARAPYTVLGWAVGDIEACVAGLVERGITFTRYEGMAQDDRGIWQAPDGSRVAWFTDPAGNVLSLSQHPA